MCQILKCPIKYELREAEEDCATKICINFWVNAVKTSNEVQKFKILFYWYFFFYSFILIISGFLYLNTSNQDILLWCHRNEIIHQPLLDLFHKHPLTVLNHYPIRCQSKKIKGGGDIWSTILKWWVGNCIVLWSLQMFPIYKA